MQRIARRRGANPRRPRGGTGFAPTYPFTITSLTPNTVAQGSPNTTIGANGIDFQSGSTVFVDGVAAPTAFQNVNLINFTLTAAVSLVPGYKAIQIKRTTFASNIRLLAVPFPVPTLLTATPTGSGNVLNVTGTGWFASGTHARIDDTIDATFTWLSSTTATVTIPQAVLDIPGTHTLRIFNDAPGGGLSAAVNFEAKFQPAVLVSLSLTEQYTGRNAGPLIIEGDPAPTSLFYEESIVKVDGTPIAKMLIDGNHIRVTIPGSLLATPGPHNITVTNPTTGGGGGESNALVFTAFTPNFIALSITEVVQYFDGFDVTGTVDHIDANFEATYNGIAQPTTLIDANSFVVHVTTAANSVPGTTTVRLRDTISGATTNSVAITVYPWDPSRVGAALRWWLDGSSIVDDGTGRASAWNDKSGGARNISQANTAKRPLIVTSTALNGKTALRFDHLRQDNFDTGVTWLTSGAAGIVNRTSYNIWVVAQNTLSGTNQTPLGEHFGYLWVCGTNVAPERLQLLNSDSIGVTATVPFTFSTGAGFVFRARKNATTIFARVNRGAEVSAGPLGNSASWSPAAVYVGSRGPGGGFWRGDIALIIVTNAELNTTFKALIDNMISYQFGLPFGTPGSAPTITSVDPNVVTQLDLPFDFDVFDTGGSFTPLSTVNVFDTALATQYLGPSQLRARMPTAALATAGGRAITVSDVGGISAPTGITVLPYVDQPGPNIYTLTPNTAYQHGAAFTCNIVGVGFTPSSVVYANGVACATTPGDATHVSAVIPASALDVLPGPLITVRDGAFESNPLEVTLTPWSPASILGLTVWYRATDVVLGTGNRVAQWTDLSGNGRHLTQATETKQPLLIAADPNFNGKPSIDFDGVDDYMTGASLAVTVGPTSTNVGVVFRADAITGTGAITAPYNNNCVVGGGVGFFGFALRNTPVAYYYENDGAYQVAQCTNVAAGVTCQVLLVGANSSAINATLNNVVGTPDTVGTMVHGAPVFSVGSNLTFVANFLNGQVAEIFASTLALTAQDAICWPNYCRYHYGTP